MTTVIENLRAERFRDRMVARGAQPVNVGFPYEWLPVLEALDDALNLLDPTYCVAQVKVKFGGLRYYISASTNLDPEDRQAMNLLIRAAERACGFLDVPRRS